MMKCSVVLSRIDISGYSLPSDSTYQPAAASVDLSLVKAEPVSPTDVEPNYGFNTLIKVKTEPVSPSEPLATRTFESIFPGDKSLVNTVRETKARPLSKIKSQSTKPLPPLTKVKAARPTQPKIESPAALDSNLSGISILDLLRRCQLCRVLLVDCMKGMPMPLYNPTSSDEDDRLVKKRKKEKKKKKVC